MANKLLQDSKGNTSSKRVFGAIGMTLFFALATFITIISVYKGTDVGNNAAQMANMIGVVSGSLLGIGVFEKESKKDIK